MGSTAAGREHNGLPPENRSSLHDWPENRFYGSLRGGSQSQASSHLQDALLDQTLAHGISQLSLSSSRDAYPSGAAGYGNGSGSGLPLRRNVVDRRQHFLFEQLGPSDTRDVESGLLRDYLCNFPLNSCSGQPPPSNLNRNGYVPSYCPNQDAFLRQGWNFPLPSVSDHPSNSNRNCLVSSSCSACGSRFIGQSSRSRNSNTDHKNRRVLWSPETLSLDLEDIRGQIVYLAKDQQGCRSLQSVLDKGSRESIDMIFSELVDIMTELMVDPFANHVVQKLVDVCSEEQRTALVGRLVNSGFQVVNICLSQYGAMAVQKLLESTESYEPLSALIMAISVGTVALIKDSYGHRVILHCLKNFSQEDTKCILNAVIAHCFEVATDKSGCCVIQQCVELSSGEQRDRLVGEIIVRALLLAEDRFGNYVIQHIVLLRDQRITANVVRQLKGNFLSLSRNKFGSNVVEKCLLESGEILSCRIIVELLEDPNVSLLLIDYYGNFVIQTALSVAQGAYYTALVNLIKQHYPVMRNNLFGQKILHWFEKRKQQHVQR